MPHVSPSLPTQLFRRVPVEIAGFAAFLAVLAAGLSARADVPLTRADVESIQNRVEFIPRGRSARAARLSDLLGVGDALRTAAESSAQLRFNDESLARVGERATFRFVPNTRNFRLSNGTMLLLIPPGRGRSTIQTPSAITGVQGSAVVVRYIEDRDLTVVMALTNNPTGPMTVTPTSCNVASTGGHDAEPANCAVEYSLYAGQMALIQNSQVQILEFDLPTFYETSPLLENLELDNPDADSSLGPALEEVRRETLEALDESSTFIEDSTVINPAVLSLDSTNASTLDEAWLLSPPLTDDNDLIIRARNAGPGDALAEIAEPADMAPPPTTVEITPNPPAAPPQPPAVEPSAPPAVEPPPSSGSDLPPPEPVEPPAPPAVEPPPGLGVDPPTPEPVEPPFPEPVDPPTPEPVDPPPGLGTDEFTPPAK
ncbi:MAG: FecR domain-containing protein [Nodosilinea sp.]